MWRQLLRAASCYGQPATQPLAQYHVHNHITIKGIPFMNSTSSIKFYSSKSQTKNKRFKVLDGYVNTDCQEFSLNAAKFKNHTDQFNQLLGLATSGGGPKGIERHTKHNKKLLAWDRAKLLFDDYSSVLEIGTLSGMQMEYGSIPRAGVLMAIGKINGIYCMVALNDGSVKGGTLFPISVKKNLRSQEIAMQNNIPYIFVVDSGGAFLPLQADIFLPGGRNFYNEAILNSKNVPQMAVVVGSCTAGGAYVPTMLQENIIVEKIGSIFLGGPPLVKAALGEEVSTEELGGAMLHCSVSGCSDYFAKSEEEAFEIGRDSVAAFNIDPVEYSDDYDEPLYSTDDLPGLIPANNQHTMNMYKVLSRLTDGSRFHEFKALYGKGLVTGFGYLQGHLVGLIGNNGPTSEESALKGSHFVQLCDQRKIPLIFLQNSWPDDVLIDKEEEAMDLGRRMCAEAKLMGVIACAEVPKLTVITGNSQGINNYTMAGRAFSPNLMFCWPNAHISMAPAKDIVTAILETKGSSEPEVKTEITKEVYLKSSAFFAASRLHCDGIILPQDTRKVLGQCLEIVKQQQQLSKQTNYSVLRM